MKALPEGLESIGTIMSNFDGSIEPDSEKKLKTGGCYGGYAAWDFFGNVWWDEGRFWCEVKQYRVHVDTISADSLQEIMDLACEKFGSA